MAESSGDFEDELEVETIFEDDAPYRTSMPDDCKKNPPHKGFIPVSNFRKENLPDDYKDDHNIMAYIMNMAALTVCLKVCFVSHDRPEKYDKTGKKYPWCDYRGNTAITRTGTGWVVNVRWDSELGTWAISVMTVRHVAFDEFEVEQTKCRFYFDKEDSVNIELQGERFQHKSDVDEDYFEFVCHTSDKKLATALQKKLSKLRSLLPEINKTEKYNITRSPKVGALAVIVSHPHGCFKHISVGKLEAKEIVKYNRKYTIYKYDTPTCKGSSGAPLWVLGMQSISAFLHPHSKTSGGFNWSAVALEND